jgi:hypothetical protein
MQYVDYLCSLQRALAQHVRRFVCACSIAELRMQSFGLFPAHRVSLHIKGNCFLNFLKKSTELSVLCNGGRLWHTLCLWVPPAHHGLFSLTCIGASGNVAGRGAERAVHASAAISTFHGSSDFLSLSLSLSFFSGHYVIWWHFRADAMLLILCVL